MPSTPTNDRPAYRAKKQFFDSLLTVYGRKPVLEALQEPKVGIHRLHLARSNRPSKILDDIVNLASAKGAETIHHDRQALSRISRNAKQDQGVAADLICPEYQPYQSFLATLPASSASSTSTIIALDRITNPQNLGLIIRSVCAGGIDGLLLPRRGCAPIDPLVIKASAGTVFRAPILRCDGLPEALRAFADKGASLCTLSAQTDAPLQDFTPDGLCVYVLGNESEGVSPQVEQVCNQRLHIPMSRGVESLNVAVTAALLAFRDKI